MRNFFRNSSIVAVGYFFVLLSLIVFKSGQYLGESTPLQDFNSAFVINYMILLVYILMMWIDRKEVDGKRFKRFSLETSSIFIVLINISAYSLNQDLPIFQQSTTWLTFFLVM